MKYKSAGVLLHITSLPNNFGVGDFGLSAFQFVDSLVEAKQTYWQILPLMITNTVTGNSPYSSPSAFAINPIFVSPEKLHQEKLIKNDFVKNIPESECSDIDYEKVTEWKKIILKDAYKSFLKKDIFKDDFDKFCVEHNDWLDDYALFEVICNDQDYQVWSQWPAALRDRKKKVLDEIRREHTEEYEFYRFVQFILYRQWFELKEYANQKGVEVIGDIPIYVEYDSVDVWVAPEYFKLDEKKKLRVVAGVPPDYFSETGQRWGNPLYNWKYLRKKGYDWWISRLKHNLHLYDIVRIDHFRGLVQYWEIPVTEPTAVNGRWRYVPTRTFFPALLDEVDRSRLIAEDLGIITDDVKDVMSRYGFSGMKILLFAFGGNLDDHPYLPHNFTESSIVYTGTHDNNTTQGWYHNDAQPNERLNFSKYLDIILEDDYLHWDLINLAYESPAKCAIVPLQDFLGLGQTARMNTPGTVNKNWIWRFSFNQWNHGVQEEVANRVVKADRI